MKDVQGSLTAQALAGSFHSEDELFDDEGSILSEALEEEISKILGEEDSDNEEPLTVERIDIQEKDVHITALESIGSANRSSSFENQ